MSEFEIQRRQEYKRNRKKWILIQFTAIILFAAIALGSFAVYNRMNQTYYVEYTENSRIDYQVRYTENDFFDGEWIEQNHSYIATLMSDILADFHYTLQLNASNFRFRCQYRIDASLQVADKESGVPFYTVEENLLPLTEKLVENASVLTVDERVEIDYPRYNEIATSFVDTYNLKNASSTLVITLTADVFSTGAHSDEQSQNSYTTSLHIPLAVETLIPYTTSDSPADEVKILEFRSIDNRNLFLILSIVSVVLTALLIPVLIVFLHITRNEDITYTARVRKIYRAYSSYIQRIEGEFDCEGYQMVVVKTFNEMLGIRDTLQAPVLMSENKDETMTRFFIPTNTKILYFFEIKVDNYDQLYAQPAEDIAVEEELTEEPVILEEVGEEELAEAMAQPDINLSDIEFVPDDDGQFAVSEEEPGVEVVGVVWPERAHKNKVYRYDPNGEILEEGDIVLVPTRDAAQGRDVIRKVAVAHGNHRVDPEHIRHPLKKIIAVLKRKVSHSLTPNANESMKNASNDASPEE